jgi:predicted nucleic-acid-binding protein
MRAVDTNVIVRVITQDNPLQADTAKAFVERGVWISHVVLAETAWVLGDVYRQDHSAIADSIEMLMTHQSVTLQDEDVVSSALQHYREKPSLGFSDCLVLEIARKAGHLPLGTFDKALGKLDGAERL